MKKNIVIAVMAVAILVLGCLRIVGAATTEPMVVEESTVPTENTVPHTENWYPLSTTVTELDYDNDIVTVMSHSGYTWSFFGCEDWDTDDICACIMDSMGTTDITDDVIIQVRYCG